MTFPNPADPIRGFYGTMHAEIADLTDVDNSDCIKDGE